MRSCGGLAQQKQTLQQLQEARNLLCVRRALCQREEEEEQGEEGEERRRTVNEGKHGSICFSAPAQNLGESFKYSRLHRRTEA